MEAWAHLSGEEPRAWEVRCIMAMDAARLSEHARLSDPATAGQVSASDTRGVQALMRGLKGRKALT